MKKTKIICTMGPNTNDKNVMLGLAKNGMDVARFNFSHGDYAEPQGTDSSPSGYKGPHILIKPAPDRFTQLTFKIMED